MATTFQTLIETFDPTRPEIWLNPYPIYAKYRVIDPVHCTRGHGQIGPAAWYLFRHADVLTARRSAKLSRRLRHQRLSSKPIPESMRPYSEMLSCWMVELDEPDHTRLRSAVSRSFAPEAVRKLQPRVQVIAAELLDSIQGIGFTDVITSFALPLPLLVMCEIVGLPRDDYAIILDWSRTFSDVENQKPTFPLYNKASKAMLAFSDYLRTLASKRKDTPEDDLISQLAGATKDKIMTEDELVGTVMLLLFAGHETTANLIGNGVYTLLRHSDQLALLRNCAERAEAAVEEIIRYEGPVQSVSIGHLTEAMELGGQTMLPGDRLMAVLGSANRDEEVFERSEEFDITRNCRQHVGFGTGLHHCLGSILARVEAQIAIHSIFERFPNLRLVSQKPAWREGLITRGLTDLPVTY